MGELSDLAISVLYALPVALLALTMARERWRPRWLTITLLAALPVFYIGHYQLWKHASGWPSDSELPDEFRLLAFQITEPDAKTRQGGEILMWVSATGQTPRVHRLGYDKQLHEDLVNAGRRNAEGVQQVGKRQRSQSSGQRGAAGGSDEAIEFADEVRPTLPAKTDAE